MIRHYVKVKLVLAVLAGLLTLPLPSFGAEKIWGSYENKIDGDKVALSIFPIGADEKSGKASVVFDLVEKSGGSRRINVACYGGYAAGGQRNLCNDLPLG